MYDVIALGELLVDLAERTKDENGYPTLAANPGGAPGNFLAALSAYGKKTAFLAKVGNDTFGHLLTGTMRRAGIDTRGILISSDTFTTLAFVTFDAHGDRSFAFARKPGADTQLRWEEIDPAMLAESRVFHFGSLSCTDEPARTATQKAAAYARMHGKLVTYDPNYRAPLWKTEQEAREQILWGLSQADIVKISDEETQFLWDCSPEEGAERVLALGAKLVMVTLGPKGCLLKNKQADFSCGCPKVHPIDTTGAGDIFGGSAVSRFLELGKAPEALTRDDLAYMARYAAAAASLSTEASGAIPSIPKKEAVLQKMQEAYCVQADAHRYRSDVLTQKAAFPARECRFCFAAYAFFFGPMISALRRATRGTVRMMPMVPATPRMISMAMESALKIWIMG